MIKVFEMFSGYGGASFALKKAGVEFEVVGFSEIDKYAIQCYQQNHQGVNFGDCMKINPLDIPNFDLLTSGFPCQAFSVAGKGLGELDTRGTLFNEIIRIAEVKQPKFMLLENVKGLTTKRHKATFEKILSELNRIGYCVNWKVLNSKEYGIPQNRERVFFICYHKSLDNNSNFFDEIDIFEKVMNFKFPEKEDLKIFLKDILEDEVDEKYYLSEKQIESLLFGSTFRQRNLQKTEVCDTLQSAMSHGNTIPCVRVKNATKKGFQEAYPGIRKLTPKECFRLMGFTEDQINLDGLSNTQKYKLAGNGWDINLVSKIFKNIFT